MADVVEGWVVLDFEDEDEVAEKPGGSGMDEDLAGRGA